MTMNGSSNGATTNGAPTSMTTNWDGNSMTQDDMMLKDTVLVVDFDDNIVGAASKKDSHVFDGKQPRGILHRAFSVFLFNEETNELLLQKRASTKITFPNVWTNTCCSHPLYGMEPNEVDLPNDVADGSVMGVKHAAVRKLDHELGIPSNELPVDKFKFLTRLHYWAADTVTHGKDSPWGEHEIDYVLFFVIPNKDVLTVQPHSDEVDEYKWVTQAKLQEMFQDKSLLFSPWFRLICQKWLCNPENGWWDNYKLIMATTEFDDYETIHRFDPPQEHLGGGGNAGLLFPSHGDKQRQARSSQKMNGVEKTTGDVTEKPESPQDKIITHSESKLKQLGHIDEVFSAITLLCANPLKSNLDSDYIQKTYDEDNLKFCEDILVSVSRSFAAVTRQLPQYILVDAMVFYLVLRALDTIEDDMVAFADDVSVKINYLLQFNKTALSHDHPNWTLDGVGEGDEKRLLQEFDKCFDIFSSLRIESQKVILDISHRMARGMAEYITKDLGQGTKNIVQYNRYCHFVAGLVGEGLSRLFACTGYEQPSLASDLYLSDQMGYFLQKTNIIRDYLEDYVDGRAFWPQEVWNKYSKTGDLGYFALQAEAKRNKTTTVKGHDLRHIEIQSLYCLHELINNALESVPDCLIYLSRLRCLEIFRFCAIPQVVAIATLDKMYGNLDVFTGLVKIRKGLSCKLVLRTNTIDEVHETFYIFSKSLMYNANQCRWKMNLNDPNYDNTMGLCQRICEITREGYIRQRRHRFYNNIFLPAALILGCFLAVKMLDDAAFSASTLSSDLNKNVGIVLICGVGAFLYMYVLGPKKGFFTDEKGRHILKSATECK